MAGSESTPYAAKYARALVDVLEGAESKNGNTAFGDAQDKGQDRNQDVKQAGRAHIEKAAAELADFNAAWEESPQLRTVYADPSIKVETKLALLDKLNMRLGMRKVLRNFLAVVIQHERMDGFSAIYGEFEAMVRGDLHISKVTWTSARELTAKEQQAVQARLAELTGGQVDANFTSDPALLGGARLRVGSTIYDGSVRGKLDQIRQTLVAS
jgi:F-type H+-transporting ATPase subunit delta